jgi:hypothetical protein
MDISAKEIAYVVLWGLTGMLVALLAGGIIELLSYWMIDRLSLTAVLYGILISQGLVFGLVVGPIAWKKVYLEGARGKKYVVKK